MMSDVAMWAFDGILAVALPLLAWRVLRSQEHRQAVVLFIAFGLLMALAWARLDAPDIAMVEAAVGAALTGVLLMSALGWIEEPTIELRRPPHLASIALPLALFTCLSMAVYAMSEPRPTLRESVLHHLGHSGVSHPVTAVLLNFRAYDTLLEVIVLVAIAIGVRALFPAARSTSHEAEVAGPLLRPLVYGLLPVFVLMAGYVVWVGSHRPGGAFQAGAVLAGGGVLMFIARPRWPPPLLERFRPTALVIGPLFFLVVATVLLLEGQALLAYPQGWAKPIIVALESLLAVSIAAALLVFFPRPLSSDPHETQPRDDVS